MHSLADLSKGFFALVADAGDVVRQTYSLGLLSLGLAVVIWFVVTDAQTPTRTEVFSSSIPVQALNLPPGLATTGAIAPVNVRITADEDVLKSLTISDFKATVDLSGVTQRTATGLSVHVDILRSGVSLVQVTPSTVDITLEPVTTQTVPVKINTVATTPLGYSVSDEKVVPETVQVSGGASLVEQIDAAWVDLNLSGVQTSLDRELVLAARGKDGRPLDVNIEPSTAKVSVTIIRTEGAVTFPVSPSISGNVAPGYKVSAVEADPSFVVLVGPVDVLQSIQTLTTDTIPVDGAQSDVQRSVKLSLPANARVYGSDEVVVRVRVVPATGQRNLQIAIQTKNLKEGLTASLSPDTLTATVSGALPVLDALPGDAVTAKIDLSNMTAGTYQLAPKVDVPAGVQLVGVDQPNVSVTIAGP
ncbi:MAG: CdaR family protein [Dehalococcoidia bacterium]